MNTYLGIEFAEDFKMSFAEFKEVFGSKHLFNDFQPEEREQEIKKAFEIATNIEVKEIEVVNPEEIKADGNDSTNVGKIKNSNAK